jgi:hypothetical protein
MTSAEFKLLNEGENWKQSHGTASTTVIDEYQNIIRQLPQYTKGGNVCTYYFFQTDSIPFQFLILF